VIQLLATSRRLAGLAAGTALLLAVSGCTVTSPSASPPNGGLGAAGPSATPTVGPSLASTLAPRVEPTSCLVPATINVLGGWSRGWPPANLVACVGSREITVVGYLAPGWGIGGIPNGLAPAWLGEWPGLPSVLWLRPHPVAGCFAADDCAWIFIFAPDAATLPLTPDRWVMVTGHFDDPAATTCHWVGPSGDPLTAAKAVAVCRQHFVVAAIADAPAPSPLP
jgi:hypothetical protein